MQTGGPLLKTGHPAERSGFFIERCRGSPEIYSFKVMIKMRSKGGKLLKYSLPGGKL